MTRLKPCPLCDEDGYLIHANAVCCANHNCRFHFDHVSPSTWSALPRRDPLACHKDRVVRDAIAKVYSKKGYRIGDLAESVAKLLKAQSRLRKRK